MPKQVDESPLTITEPGVPRGRDGHRVPPSDQRSAAVCGAAAVRARQRSGRSSA